MKINVDTKVEADITDKDMTIIIDRAHREFLGGRGDYVEKYEDNGGEFFCFITAENIREKIPATRHEYELDQAFSRLKGYYRARSLGGRL